MHSNLRFPLRVRKRLSTLTLLVVGVLILAACGRLPEPTVTPERYDYAARIRVTEADQPEIIAARYGGDVVAWRPEAGFAILGLHQERMSELVTLDVLDPNLDAVQAPEVEAAGWTAWAGGWTAWAGGWTAWAGGWTAWAGGWTAWAGGATMPSPPPENVGIWSQVRLPQAQVLTNNLGAGIKVAVIDTGIDLQHPAFQGRLAPASEWYDWVDGDAVPQEGGTIDDAGYGHGTAAAGVILQVAPMATILPLRVLAPDGSGDVTNVVAAIDKAVQAGADVINLSLGTSVNVLSLQAMVDYATSQGVYVVASAGNTGTTQLTYPAMLAPADDHLISVGSVDAADNLSVFSASGPEVELYAPGEMVYAPAPGNMIAYRSGTSFAAPVVAGAIALGLADATPTTPVAMEPLLETNGDVIGSILTYPAGGSTAISVPRIRLDVGSVVPNLPGFVPRSALFVTGSKANSGDPTVKAILEDLGYSVTEVDEMAATAADAGGKHLVVISSTVKSSNVNTVFRDVTVPVLVYESYLYDDMGMTNPMTNNGYGEGTNADSVSVTVPGHLLSGGLSGTVHVLSSPDNYSWGAPATTAIVAATTNANASVFGYEQGATMVTGVAPARRVGFFFRDNSANALTADGLRMFESALTWAAMGGSGN